MDDLSSGSRRKPNYYLQDTNYLVAQPRQSSPPSPATPSPPPSDQSTPPLQSPEATAHSLAPRPTSKTYQPNSSELRSRDGISYSKTRDKGKRRQQQSQQLGDEDDEAAGDPYYRSYRSDSYNSSLLRNVSSPPALQVTPPRRNIQDITESQRLASSNYPPSSYTYGASTISPRASLGGGDGESGATIFTRADDRSPLEKLQLELKHIGKEEGLTGKDSEGISRSLSRKQAERLSRSTSLTARVTSRRLSESDGTATPKGRRALSAEPTDHQSDPGEEEHRHEEEFAQPAKETFANRAKRGPSTRWRAPYDPNDPNDVEISPVSSIEDFSDTPVASSRTPVQVGSRQDMMTTPTKATYSPGLAQEPHFAPQPEARPPQPPLAALSEKAPLPREGGTTPAMSDTETPDGTPRPAVKPDWQQRWHLRGHFHRHRDHGEEEPKPDDHMHNYDGEFDGQIDNLAHLRASDINIPENIDAHPSDGLRKQRLPSTHLGDDQAFAEVWRGTIMILTQNQGPANDEAAPRLRLFAQSSSLGIKNNLDPPPRPASSPATLDHASNGNNGVASPKSGEHFPPDNLHSNGHGQASNQGFRRGKDGERANKYREVEATRLLSEAGVTFWRFHIEVELADEQQRIAYKINNGPSIGFWVPAKDQTMNIMFYSCNGFSLSVNPDDFQGPDPMWRDVLRNHQKKPYHVMLGGGDQVYMDCVMNQTKLFGQWLETRNPLHKYSAPFTPEMREELEKFYRGRYAVWFSQGLFGVSASQIPTVNIFDDHDIIDGFGSYANHFNTCPVFSGLGKVAFKYYMLFQHHTMMDEGEHSEPSWLLGANPGPYITEYSRSTFMFLGRKIAFLGLDCRTERTRDTIVTQETYDRILERLNREIVAGETKHLIILLGVPIAYPRMVWLENILTSSVMTPIKKLGSLGNGTLNGFLNRFDGTVELLDDMMDHWTARGHKAERNTLVLAMQKLAVAKNVRVTFLGGDVHLASFGHFYSKKRLKIPKKNDHRYMLNVVSSAIVNTPPPNGLADFLNKRATKSHKLGNSTEETQIKVFFTDPAGKKRNNNTMMPARNYCTISENTSGRSLSSRRDVMEPEDKEDESLVDRVEGLDIVVSCEVDQHDPSGKTRAYGMTVPALHVDGYRSTSEFDGVTSSSVVTDGSSVRVGDRDRDRERAGG